MRINTRRNFFGKMATIVAFVTGAPKLFGEQAPAAAPTVGSTPADAPAKDTPRRPSGDYHTLNGIYYFFGTGSNDGYSKEDHILVTDLFEKHVTRTMDALSRSSVPDALWIASSIFSGLSLFTSCRHPCTDRQGTLRRT
jgi:hypothetical protein